MTELEKQEQYWLQKTRAALTQLQVQFVKPITELTEGFENYLNILQMKKQEETKRAREKPTGEKEKQKGP